MLKEKSRRKNCFVLENECAHIILWASEDTHTPLVLLSIAMWPLSILDTEVRSIWKTPYSEGLVPTAAWLCPVAAWENADLPYQGRSLCEVKLLSYCRDTCSWTWKTTQSSQGSRIPSQTSSRKLKACKAVIEKRLSNFRNEFITEWI